MLKSFAFLGLLTTSALAQNLQSCFVDFKSNSARDALGSCCHYKGLTFLSTTGRFVSCQKLTSSAKSAYFSCVKQRLNTTPLCQSNAAGAQVFCEANYHGRADDLNYASSCCTEIKGRPEVFASATVLRCNGITKDGNGYVNFNYCINKNRRIRPACYPALPAASSSTTPTVTLPTTTAGASTTVSAPFTTGTRGFYCGVNYSNNAVLPYIRNCCSNSGGESLNVADAMIEGCLGGNAGRVAENSFSDCVRNNGLGIAMCQVQKRRVRL